MQRTHEFRLGLVAAATLALLAACGRPVENAQPQTDNARVERTPPSAAEQAERSAERAGDKAENSAERAAGAMASGTERAGNAIERGAEKAANATSDAAVTAAAKAALLAAPELSALRIDVDTKGGVVTLKGDVKSLSEKSRAEQVVGSVAGVQSVVNDLRVTG